MGSRSSRRWCARAAVAAAGTVVLALSLWAGAASAGRGAGTAATGTLELCKSADGGTTGTSFSFTATSGSKTVTTVVPGGSCVDVALAAGTWAIAEDLSNGLWTMTGATVQPDTAFVSENDRAGKVRVTITAGEDTQVTVVNHQASASIKVCKWSRSTALQGKQFSFSAGSQNVVATAGASADTAGCGFPITTQPGSRIKVSEAVPAGVAVAGIAVSSNASSTPVSSSAVKVTAGPGINVVTFEDEPVGPPQTGFIELCKDAGDRFISSTAPFTFTLTDSAGFTDTEQVLAGQCTAAIKVAAGTVTVGETPTDATVLSSVSTDPSDALGLTNLDNRTTLVVVPVSAATSGEVVVHFVNSTQTAPLKICKYLATGSEALAGQTFTVDVADEYGDVFNVKIVAAAGSNGACKFVTYGALVHYVGSHGSTESFQFPVGSAVTATENLARYSFVSGDGNAPGADDPQSLTIAPGINTLPFHNQALGQLEICKNMQTSPTDDTIYDGTVFHFSVDGGKPIDVAAGACSLPLVVPAGSHTVKEVNIPYGFMFVSSTATGPLNDNRATSGTAANGGNSITVTVPYFDGSPGGETQVTVVNKVIRAFVKICKVVPTSSSAQLGSATFSFVVLVFNVDTGFFVAVDVKAGACTGLIGGDDLNPNPFGFPIVGSDGNPTQIFVGEGFNGGYHVSQITLTGGVFEPGSPDLVCGSATADPTGGPAVFTFTNVSGDIDMSQCGFGG